MLATRWFHVVVACVLWPSVSMALGGCSSLLPAHANSEDADGETVSLTLLDEGQFETASAELHAPKKWEKKVWEDNRLTATKDQSQRMAALPVGAAQAISVISGFVSNALHAEQEKYTAQFTVDGECDDFWISGSKQGEYVQRIAGFRLQRRTKKAEPAAAFDLLCELRGVRSATEKVTTGRLQVIPVAMKVMHAKAKVLHMNWEEAYSVLWMWLFHSSDAINVTVQASMEGTWDGPQMEVPSVKSGETTSQVPTQTNVALGVVDFKWDQYSIADPAVVAPDQPKRLIQIPLAYFTAEPPAAPALKLALKVVVTEQDASNATKYLNFLIGKADDYRQK